MPFVQAAAIGRVGEPDRAVGMRHDVIRRVERLTVKGIRNHGHRAVMLPAHNASEKILAGELPALMVEGIAVRVVGRPAERRDPSVLPDITVLNVAGYVAEDEILPLARPSRAFGPIGAGPHPADRRTPQPDTVEGGIDDDDIRVGIDRRAARRPIARWAADRAGGGAELRIGCGLRLRSSPVRGQRGGADDAGARQQSAARQWLARGHMAPPIILPVRWGVFLTVGASARGNDDRTRPLRPPAGIPG